MAVRTARPAPAAVVAGTTVVNAWDRRNVTGRQVAGRR